MSESEYEPSDSAEQLDNAEPPDSGKAQSNPGWIGWGPKPLQVSASGFTKEEIQWILDGIRKYSNDYVRIRKNYPFRFGTTSAMIRSLHSRLQRIQVGFQQKRITATDEELVEILSERRIVWTDEETDALRKAVKEFGHEWRVIANNSAGTLLERFNNVQMQRRWEIIKRQEELAPKPLKQFVVLDVADEFGNPYTVRGRYASEAVRKLVPLGFELLRIQEKGDDKVHAFKVSRQGGIMRIALEDPSDPLYAMLNDQLYTDARRASASADDGEDTQGHENAATSCRENDHEHENADEPDDVEHISGTLDGSAVDDSAVDQVIAESILLAEEDNVSVRALNECSAQNNSELGSTISFEKSSPEENQLVPALNDTAEIANCHESERGSGSVAETGSEKFDSSKTLQSEQQQISLKALRKRLRDELRALKSIQPASSEERKRLKLQKEELKRQLQEYQN